MERTRWIALVVGVFATLLIIAVATAEPVPIADRAPSLPFSLPEIEVDITIPTTEPVLVQPSPVRERTTERAEWMTLAIELSLMFMLLAAVALIAKRLWQKRPALAIGGSGADEPFDVLDDIAEAMADDAATQREILRTGAPRNAIVECWLRVETLVADSGLEPDPSDTSAEFTSRVFRQFDVDHHAVASMAALYREARFSSHTMDESHRVAAIAALDEIHGSLRATERAEP